MKPRRLVLDAMLVAMYVALSLFSIPLWNMKITLEALPILVGALLLGPLDGFLIGFLGSFLNQLLTYGLTPTTLLWVLPHALSGLAVGFMGRCGRFRMERLSVAVVSVVSALLVTVLNTFAMYADSKIFGYYSRAYVFGALALRILTGVLTALVFAAILPPLLRAVARFLERSGKEN